MSYKYRVLSDRPVGYWRLKDSILTDETTIPNNGTFGTGSTPVFTDIAPLTTGVANELTFNACRITNTTSFKINNNYRMFYKGYELSTFGIEFWLYCINSPSQNNNIVTVKDASGNQMGRIYVNADAIYFEINGKSGGNQTSITLSTSRQVLSWDNKVHVYALYDGRKLDLFVNGLSTGTYTLPSDFIFNTAVGTSSSIVIGPSISSAYFNISDLAIYTRKLSVNELKSHMVWASRDSDPVHFVEQGSAYYFDLKTRENNLIFKKEFISPELYNEGAYNNLVVDGSGLTFAKTTNSAPGYGTWQCSVLLPNYIDMQDVDVRWDMGLPEGSVINSDYAKVSVSYDNGSTFYEIKNNQPLTTFFNYKSVYSSISLLFKVEMYSTDTSAVVQPRIDNFSVYGYKTADMIADSGGFKIAPLASQTTGIRKNNFNFIFRSRNFGLNLDSSSTLQVSSTNSNTFSSLEFWFKWAGNGDMAIVDSGLTAQADLYIQSGIIKNNMGSGKFYLNGIDLTAITNKTLVADEPYHVVLVYNSPVSNSTYLNGSKTNWKPAGKCTIGYINLYPNQLTSGGAQNRYLSYVATSVGSLNDGSTAIGSILEYSGDSSSYNGGLAVIAHEHVF